MEILFSVKKIKRTSSRPPLKCSMQILLRKKRFIQKRKRSNTKKFKSQKVVIATEERPKPAYRQEGNLFNKERLKFLLDCFTVFAMTTLKQRHCLVPLNHYFFSMNIPENLFSLTALLNALVSFIALRCKLSWDSAANLS